MGVADYLRIWVPNARDENGLTHDVETQCLRLRAKENTNIETIVRLKLA